MIPARRQLEDMIGELADAVLGVGGNGAVRPTSIDLKLPVETRVENGSHGMSIVADLPRLHMRTHFDWPLGQLTLTLGEVAVEAPA